MKYIVAIAAALLLLTGCLEPEPVVTKPEDAQSLVDHIVYVKDRRGICYAVASVQRISTGGHVAENVMMSEVDCQKAGL